MATSPNMELKFFVKSTQKIKWSSAKKNSWSPLPPYTLKSPEKWFSCPWFFPLNLPVKPYCLPYENDARTAWWVDDRGKNHYCEAKNHITGSHWSCTSQGNSTSSARRQSKIRFDHLYCKEAFPPIMSLKTILEFKICFYNSHNSV